MANKPLSIEQLRDKIHTGEAKDPLVFLEAIMNGTDPRKISELYKLIIEIDDLSDGPISEDDWAEVVDYVLLHAKYQPVTISESTSAAKTIAEYMHAKRKQVEMSGGLDNTNMVSFVPLTKEEIKLFKKKFNDEY